MSVNICEFPLNLFPYIQVHKALFRYTLHWNELSMVSIMQWVRISKLNSVCKSCMDVPVVTSWMSSAAVWQPSTRRWLQVDSSFPVSTRNRWVSTPCLVPKRRPNVKSDSCPDELFPGPEWTSLKETEIQILSEKLPTSDQLHRNSALLLLFTRHQE